VGFFIAIAVGAILGWVASFARPAGRPRRAGLSVTTGIIGGLAGGFVLGPVMGGGNLFEALVQPMTPVVTTIGAVTLLAALLLVRRRFNRARSLPTE
jgi:uncharacterized membrane protein YeaQ/YmgE (transglycosylase-associated protein family)